MITMNYLYENLTPTDSVLRYADKDDILYFDIETTGLSRVKNHIYLIGCGYYSDKGLHIIQWFAENEYEESAVLNCFVQFSSSFSSLINYNGKSFDIPFTTERLNKYNMSMPEFNSTDIYTIIKPLKKLLSLDNLTQKAIEEFLGVKRDDPYNGGELIYVYKDYTKTRNKGDLDKLLLHNKEDVLNMHYVAGMTEYLSLLDNKFEFKSYQVKTYCDYNGCEKSEILITASHDGDTALRSFNSFYNCESGSYILNYSNTGTVSIRIPVINDNLKYYMPNYKDYYYLPAEGICIFKSMAGGIDRSLRENAKKETCYITCSDTFIPIKDKTIIPDSIKSFKSEYKSKHEYIRLKDFEEMDDTLKTLYVSSIIYSFR